MVMTKIMEMCGDTSLKFLSILNHAGKYHIYITTLSYQKVQKKQFTLHDLSYYIISNRLKIVKVLSNHKISIESENYNDNYSILTSKVKGLLTNR